MQMTRNIPDFYNRFAQRMCHIEHGRRGGGVGVDVGRWELGVAVYGVKFPLDISQSMFIEEPIENTSLITNEVGGMGCRGLS